MVEAQPSWSEGAVGQQALVDDDQLIGQVLAERYRIEILLGRGAMGSVYRAEHIHMRKPVALKILHAELTKIPDMVQRFEQEAQAAAQIEHPHVAAATDFGKLPDGSIYLALEYIEGVPLSEPIKNGPIAPRRALDITHQIASALEVAHSLGIVHRDLKPDNLLLVSGEQHDFIKVLDFGIAKLPDELQGDSQSLTLAGMVCGTPEYMAPEQALAQEVDGRADIYALGVILFEMLTGRRPYLGASASLVGQQLSQPLPRMSEMGQGHVPPAIEQLVAEMLATEPKNRITNVSILREQIEALEFAWDQGRLKASDNRSTPLVTLGVDDAAAVLENGPQTITEPVKSGYAKRTSRTALLAFGFGAFGVAAAVLGVNALEDEEPVAPSQQLVAPSAPMPDESPADLQMLSQIKEARLKGLDALRALAEQFPAEGKVQAELSLELAKVKKYGEAIEAARSALALDPQLNENPKVAGALFRAAQANSVRAACFRLLQGPMGAAGVSIIFDLAHTTGVNSRVRAEAQALLSKAEVREAAAPPLLLVLDLERASTCEDFEVLVKRAAVDGDRRALPLLAPLSVTTGCGPKKQGDCYSCLRRDSSLSGAITTINQRNPLSDGE